MSQTPGVIDYRSAPGGPVHPHRLFLGCFISLVATAFGFIVRAFLIDEWGTKYGLTGDQKGAIIGAGLFPFAISIILFSLIVDKLGYGKTMAFAWIAHVLSAILTITAPNFEMLYLGTLIFALGNGAVEAVINPVTATLYPRNKTHWLNILHAGWPGGLVLGGVLAIAIAGLRWEYKVALVLIPTVIYGILLVGQKFPVQERVAAGVSYADMMREFGAAGAFVLMYFLTMAMITVVTSFGVKAPGWVGNWLPLALSAVAFILFFGVYKSFGRPMFVFLLLIMILLATTELGVDSWVVSLMTPILEGKFGATAGAWLLVYTSMIMFVLRFFAGPIVHVINPLGLLAICAAIACGGLLFLSAAGDAALAVFIAATMYGLGKTFFWPTTLGVVSEQFPKGGALTLNAMGGMGMIAVGVLGGPILGALLDRKIDRDLAAQKPALHQTVQGQPRHTFGIESKPIDEVAKGKLPEPARKEIDTVSANTKQSMLAQVAILPGIMFVCYLGMIFYFKARGGYKAVHLTGEQATGGVTGPVEA